MQAEGPGFESPSLHQIGARFSDMEAASFLCPGAIPGAVGITLIIGILLVDREVVVK